MSNAVRWTPEQYEAHMQRRKLAVPDRRTEREFAATLAVLPPAERSAFANSEHSQPGFNQFDKLASEVNGSPVDLTLPWPPSVNRIWRNVAIGGKPRTLTSGAGRDFFARASAEVRTQRAGRRITGRAIVELTLHAPTRAQYDVDNRAKATLDSLAKGGVIDNDNQIDVLIVQRGEVIKGGKVVVRVSELVE